MFEILYHLHSATAKTAIANAFEGKRKKESEIKREVEADHEGEKVSHFPSC